MNWRRHLLLFLLLVPAFNTLAVLALPHVINRVVMHRIVDQALQAAALPASDAQTRARQDEILRHGGINIALPALRAEATARTVVRPSPDLLYTACVFDLSNGPLRITAPVPDSYLSVSGFAADTSNFFAINDSAATTAADGARTLDLLLNYGTPNAVPDGARLVQVSSERGLILFRMLIPNEADLPHLTTEFQARQHCDAIQRAIASPVPTRAWNATDRYS